MPLRQITLAAITIISTALLAPLAFAQLPAARLASVVPLSASPGQTVEVTLAGTDLDNVTRLQFTHAGITAKQKMLPAGPFDDGPQPAENVFELTVAGNVPPGRYEVRAEGTYGVSNSRTIVITKLATSAEVEPNNTAEEATELELPIDCSGQFAATADCDYYRFTAVGSQRIILDCYAYRADSAADAVVSVYDANGRELASSRDAYRRDPLVDFQTAAGQTYTIKVHDAGYRGGIGYQYRFTLGALPHIDYVFPPAALAGGNRPFTIYGRNLPAGQNAGLSIDGRPLQKQTVNINLPAGASPTNGMFVEPVAGAVDAVAYRIDGKVGASNPVFAAIASAPPVVEKEPNNAPTQAQPLALPSEAMGQFYPARDSDWYTIQAEAGDSISIEVISDRLGMGTNPNLVIQHVALPAEGETEEKVSHVAFVSESEIADSGDEFQTLSGDPVYRFTADAGGEYRLLLRDKQNALRADPRHVYRLAVRKDKPDFRLAAVPIESYSSVLLRKGGRVGVRVIAFRRDGFNGEIRVTATGLPAGVTCEDAVIGPDRSAAMLTLTAAGNAAVGSAKIRIVGNSQLAGAAVERVALLATSLQPVMPRQNNRARPPISSRFAEEIVVCVSDELAPAILSAGDAKVWETSRGGILRIPYARTGPFKGTCQLTARGLPANITSPQLTINANQISGEHELKLTSSTPVGTYTFQFEGIAQQVDYVHKPEAAEAAAERKVEVDKIATEAAATAKTMTDAKTAAEKVTADAKTALDQATAKHTLAEQTLTQATAVRDTATTNLATAKKALAAKADDPTLKTNVTTAEKALADSEANLKAATLAVTTAKKELDDATARSTTAAEELVVATEKATEATELAKLATELKAETDKRATDTANAAKPKKINVPIVSTPVTLTITPSPVDLAPLAANYTVKQGEKLELPIKLTRKYGFTAAINLQLIAPQGVAGVSIPNASVAANQPSGKLAVAAAATATPGKHEYTLRATMNFNGQNITIEEPLALAVEEVKQEAK